MLSHAVEMVVFRLFHFVVAVVLIPSHAIESVALMFAHFVAAVVLMFSHALLRVVLIVLSAPLKKPVMLCQAFLIPLYSPSMRKPPISDITVDGE